MKCLFLIRILLAMSVASYSVLSMAESLGAQCHAQSQALFEISNPFFKSAVGLKRDDLSLVAYRDGKFVPIVSQFDSPVLRQDFTRVLADDVLLIRQQDVGILAPKSILPEGYIITVPVKMPHKTGVVYLIKKPLIYTNTLIHYAQKSGVVETACFKLKTEPNNFLIWQGFFYKGIPRYTELNILDGFDIQLVAELVNILPNATASNQDFAPVVLAMQEGPLRTRVWMRARSTFLKIPVTDIHMSWTIEQLSLENKVEVVIPTLIAKMIKRPLVYVFLKTRQLQGSHLFTSLNPKQAVLLDGVMSPAEKALNNRLFDENKNWLQVQSPLPMTIGSQVTFPEQAAVPLHLFYQDDEQSARIGYALVDFPVDRNLMFSLKVFLDQ